jgi:DNA-binding response OmpR family regulator
LPKVLVVDDEAMIRSALTKILVSQGYDVFLARNGKEGLLACRDLPDIVILDVDMPGLSGFKVLEALREERDTRDLPVVMLTSTPPLLGEQTAMDFGVAHYLTKPWTVGTVEAVVRVALREAKVAKGEGDDFSGYLKPKRKKKKRKPEALPKTHPDIIMPTPRDSSGTSQD